MEIRLTDTKALDEISIRTNHSDYSFRVTDPVESRGLLSGGRLGNKPCEALFSGVLIPSTFKKRATLEVGTRALFYVTINNRLKFMITSLITSLAISAASGREEVAQAC
jgi:hypothetical protein